MTTDQWVSLMEQAIPEYLRLKLLADTGPTVKARLEKKNLLWYVRIHEDWASTPPELQYQYYTLDDDKWLERIEWADEQLKTWKFVKKMDSYSWAFGSKTSAEKFIMLYNLRWDL